MSFEQLRIFVAVAELEHMTRAAERLGLTQSGVSAAIAALEARYDTPLFHRVGRHVELTSAGKLFLNEARDVLKRTAAAEMVLAEIAGLKRGVLDLHASKTIASYWLPRHLVEFHRSYPDIRIRLTVGNTAEVAKAITDGTAEIGFVEGFVDEPTLTQQAIADDQLMIVVGRQHPWAGKRGIEPHELLQTEWVLREQGSGTRSEFEKALKNLGISLQFMKIALELPSNEAVRGAVEAGAGATAISELLVERGIRLGTLHRIQLDLPRRSFLLLVHRERRRSKTAAAFLALIAAASGPAFPERTRAQK